RLAGPVRTEEPGDARVGGREVEVAHRGDGAEALREAAYLDHGAGPLTLRKNGIGRAACVQPASSAAGSADSRKRAMTRSMQGAVSCPCPKPGSTISRARAKPRAASCAYAGGVTGSSEPESSSAGTALESGARGGGGARGQRAHTTRRPSSSEVPR